MHYLRIDDIEKICYEYAKAHLSYDEPLPSFRSRYPGILEGVLHAPQTKVYGQEAHSTVAAKAAVLFYEMIKQHPFLNGNKRMACVSMMVFLSLNKRWLYTSWENLYETAVDVARSDADKRPKVLKALAGALDKSIKEINEEEMLE